MITIMLLSVNDAAAELGVTGSLVRRLCRAGRIAGAKKVGGHWVITSPITRIAPSARPRRERKEEVAVD